MTAIVGVLCSNGIVIGTDSSATLCAGPTPTIEQRTEKISIIDEKIILTGTGAVGLGQRFCAIIEDVWKNKTKIDHDNIKVFDLPPIQICTFFSHQAINNFKMTGLHLPNIPYGALVAFPAHNTYHLCEFSISDFQPELITDKLWYISMGSAQPITDPFLAFIREVFWKDKPPNLNDGIFAVTWTLDHAIKVNPGGVNGPIELAVLEKKSKYDISARLLDDDELNEHRQNVEAAQDYLSKFPSQFNKDNIPEPPQK